jgi:hypothetical protein
MDAGHRPPDSRRGIAAIAVAPLRWEARASGEGHPVAGAVIGHIVCDGDRFRVGLDGEELEAYSFGTLGECVEWFDEFRFALGLGTDGSPMPLTR